MDYLKIQYQITHDDTFFAVLHKALGGELVSEKELVFPENHPVLSGSLVRRNTIDGMVRIFIARDLRFKKAISLERLPDVNNDFLAINIHMSDAPLVQKVDEQHKVMARLNEGLFFNTSNLGFTQDFPIGETFSFINFTTHKQKLRDYLKPKEGEFMYKILQKHRKFSVYETATSSLLLLAEEIMNLDMSKNLNKMSLESKVTEFTFQALKKVEIRSLEAVLLSINEIDINAIYATRKLLLNDPSNPPSIAVLAKAAAMSDSKLKTLFKEIYGESIYQHFLNYRMDKAYQLIQQNSYTIGEVSSLLGYVNPSQFSKKFKDHFNFLPNDVLKNA
jgi:AraC-like DNA-binding protein